MCLKDGKYSAELHHNSYLSVGVPGTVAGLHLAWKEHGKLPWKRLVEPAIALARDGFSVSDGARAVAARACSATMQKYPASVAAFTKNGVPYEAGETLKQPDLARTLERIATQGPAGFYEGETGAAAREGHGRERRADHARGPEDLHRRPARADHGHAIAATTSSRCRRPAPAASA